jgi:hypothetical protein
MSLWVWKLPLDLVVEIVLEVMMPIDSDQAIDSSRVTAVNSNLAMEIYLDRLVVMDSDLVAAFDSGWAVKIDTDLVEKVDTGTGVDSVLVATTDSDRELT